MNCTDSGLTFFSKVTSNKLPKKNCWLKMRASLLENERDLAKLLISLGKKKSMGSTAI